MSLWVKDLLFFLVQQLSRNSRPSPPPQDESTGPSTQLLIILTVGFWSSRVSSLRRFPSSNIQKSTCIVVWVFVCVLVLVCRITLRLSYFYCSFWCYIYVGQQQLFFHLTKYFVYLRGSLFDPLDCNRPIFLNCVFKNSCVDDTRKTFAIPSNWLWHRLRLTISNMAKYSKRVVKKTATNRMVFKWFNYWEGKIQR